ncbi:MAG: tetratricopeptide repeat protein [Rikenellaceae bacterium]
MKKETTQHSDPEIKIENAITQTESFIERNSKKLTIILAVAVVLAIAIFGYTHFYKIPRQAKASVAAYVAEQYFAQDSLSLALNGDGSNDGFIAVVDQYGSTPTGNLAAHYAGICFLKLGDYESAMTYLKKYKDVDGDAAAIINAQNKGLIGDVYSQKKDYKNAISLYEKAIAASDNMLTAPIYLKKSGLIYEEQQDFGKALECYQKIKTTYFNSMEARDIDKYIARLQQK